MAQYSNIKLPALYIPLCDYLQSVGNVTYRNDELNSVHLLNPTKTHRISLMPEQDFVYNVEFKDSLSYSAIADSDGYIYIFILGHNFEESSSNIEIKLIESIDNGTSTGAEPRLNIVNDSGIGESSSPYNGFSIFKAKFSVDTFEGFEIRIRSLSETEQTLKLGCVSLCSKWNPPHNPDLSVTMTRQYDGVKTVKTKGGATLSDAAYTRGGTYWTSSYAWELEDGDYNQGESFGVELERTLGRRLWNMKFSYLKPENLMPKSESLNSYDTSLTANTDFNLYSQSFFSRVLNRVQGSHLPFIFLANDTDPNYNPDQWAICRFDQNDFSITQSAPELYSMSMQLRESW